MAQKNKIFIEYQARFTEAAFERCFEESIAILARQIRKQILDRKESGVPLSWSTETGKNNSNHREKCIVYQGLRKRLNGTDN